MNEAVTMNAQPVRSVILLSIQMYDDTVLESQRRTNVSMLRVSVELIFGEVADTRMIVTKGYFQR
jgi:hypothetical protein